MKSGGENVGKGRQGDRPFLTRSVQRPFRVTWNVRDKGPSVTRNERNGYGTGKEWERNGNVERSLHFRISEITACVIRFLSLTFLVPSRTVRSLRVWSSPPSSPVASLLSVRYGNEVSDVRSERETVPFGCARLTTLCSHFPHSTLFTRRLVVALSGRFSRPSFLVPNRR